MTALRRAEPEDANSVARLCVHVQGWHAAHYPEVFFPEPDPGALASHFAERLRDHALFIAFAPAEAPKLAVAVLVENGGHGSSAAAPVARALFDAYLIGNG